MKKKGVMVRPWKGPLPKRKPQTLTLEAFFLEADSKNLRKINLAKFGRSLWDLIPSGPRGKRVIQAKEKPSTLPPHTSSKNLVPPPLVARTSGTSSYAEIVRTPRASMPPHPRTVDRWRGHGPNQGDGHGRGDTTDARGAFQFQAARGNRGHGHGHGDHGHGLGDRVRGPGDQFNKIGEGNFNPKVVWAWLQIRCTDRLGIQCSSL